MTKGRSSRRQFGTTAAALAAVGLAGCAGDDGDNESDDNGDNDSVDLDDPGALTLYFENEDGEPVSTGIEVLIEHAEEDYSSNHAEEISDGELLDVNLLYEGEYTVTVTSSEGEFDDVEETITLEEGEDVEETITLEGATPDSEVDDEELDEEEAEEGEEDEDGEDDEDDVGEDDAEGDEDNEDDE
jgi:hypothetical protein